MIMPILGIYEIAVRVKQLARAEKFYMEVLGLEVGLRVAERKMLFLRAGGEGGMIVLQEDPGDWPTQHFAFTVDEAEMERAANILRGHGVEVKGPFFHEWMPAASLYFTDPDGHDLELCAPGKRS